MTPIAPLLSKSGPIIKTITVWIYKAAPIIRIFVKKAAAFVVTAVGTAEALRRGRKIFDDYFGSDSAQTSLTKQAMKREGRTSSGKSEITALVLRIEENKKSLQAIIEENNIQHRSIKLQIEVMELIVSSQTFERFANNIKIHASNLEIHFQALMNTQGITRDIGHYRYAIKALMQTVNNMIRVQRLQKDGVKMISGVDVEKVSGAVSLWYLAEAFENCRVLLLTEIASFHEAVDAQSKHIENIRTAAKTVPDASNAIASWLDDTVEPALREAELAVDDLDKELRAFPALSDLHDVKLKKEMEEEQKEMLALDYEDVDV